MHQINAHRLNAFSHTMYKLSTFQIASPWLPTTTVTVAIARVTFIKEWFPVKARHPIMTHAWVILALPHVTSLFCGWISVMCEGIIPLMPLFLTISVSWQQLWTTHYVLHLVWKSRLESRDDWRTVAQCTGGLCCGLSKGTRSLLLHILADSPKKWHLQPEVFTEHPVLSTQHTAQSTTAMANKVPSIWLRVILTRDRTDVVHTCWWK